MNRRERRFLNPKTRCAICRQPKVDPIDSEMVEGRPLHGKCARERRMAANALAEAVLRIRNAEKERS